MTLLRSIWRAAFGRLGPPDGVTLPPEDEVILRGIACVTKGFGGGRWGPLLLTHEKVIWYENHAAWPLKRQHRSIDLTQVAAVDHGTLLDLIGGGRRLRLRMKNGKSIRFYEGGGQRSAWIEAIRRELSRNTSNND